LKTKTKVKKLKENKDLTTRNYKNFKDISEYFSNAITEVSKIDRDNNMISGVCAFRPISLNNRIYKEKAIKSLVKMMEHTKAFRNHGSMFSSAGVEDLLGEHINVRRHSGGIFSDLSILETARYKDMIFDIAENKPHLAGFSINARGKFADEPDTEGREVVEDIVSLRSVDFVGDPATTFGVFEQKKFNGFLEREKSILELAKETAEGNSQETKENNIGGDRMDKTIAYLDGKIKMKGLTEGGVDSAVLEYIKTLEDAQESLTTSTAQLTEDSKQNEEEAMASKKELEKVQEEYKTVQAKLTSFEDKEADEKFRKERKTLIDKILEDEKFPKEKISKSFMRILMEIKETKEETAEARIKDLVVDRAGTLKPDDNMDETSGAEQKEEEKEEENKKTMTLEEARKHMAPAIGNKW